MRSFSQIVNYITSITPLAKSCYRLLVTNVCVDKENNKNGCILTAIKVARRNIERRQGDNRCLTFLFPFLSVWKEKKTAIK